MAVTYLKTKPKQDADIDPYPQYLDLLADIPTKLDMPDLVDMVGRLQDAADNITQHPVFLRLKEAKEALKARLEDIVEKPEVTHKQAGHVFMAELSKKTQVRKLEDVSKALLMLGDEVFMKVATVPLKALDDYLTPEQRAEVLTTSYGSRTLTVKRKKA